jgi:hypothetical protein
LVLVLVFLLLDEGRFFDVGGFGRESAGGRLLKGK